MKMKSGKTILVTGGAGFIGSHLCARLLERGDDVVCMDNFFTGSMRNVDPLLANPRFQVVRHDVCLPYSMYVDEIYNLACPASPVHYQRDPLATFKTSVFGALHALELAAKWGAKVFQASTSEVYGDPFVHPQPETYWGHVNPIGIRSCYDEGKRGAETLFFDYRRTRGTRIKVVRIFNTYGPNMNPEDGRVVSNFIVQAMRGEDITIYGDGTQTRSFCYVDDLVRGFMAMMDTSDEVTGPVNLGNPGEFTMLELAEKVLKLTGSASKIVHRPLPQDDPKQRKPDISKAGSLLDWEPEVALDEGLGRTIGYFAQPG
ncbi:MAG: SDR family oxidoreductase [Spirochaetales bacterium]|nr:SDR family oxidoreductase [Spirochaetales bacterium]